MQGCAAIGVGGLILLLAGWQSAEGLASRSWPATDGRVTVARSSPRSQSQVAWFSYEFTVDGRVYTGSRVDTAQASATQETVAAHPLGSTVRVYYDPAEPARAVLSPGLTATHGWWFGAAAAAILGGWWLLQSAGSEWMGERPATGRLYRPQNPWPADGV